MSAAAFASSAITLGAPARQPRAQLSLRVWRRSDAGGRWRLALVSYASAPPMLDLLASRSKKKALAPCPRGCEADRGRHTPKLGWSDFRDRDRHTSVSGFRDV